jgi:glycerol-3-phosphate dehydrogenase
MAARPDLSQLAREPFDVVVVGAGIYGACVAREAARNGLRVALLDRGDFGGETTANSLRTMHGGLRYLQHLDFRRMRESIRSRRDWLAQFPQLVRPLEFVLPTFGHGLLGREVLAGALLANDVVSCDRNRGLPASQHLPRGRTVGRAEAARLLDGTALAGYTGAAVWYDGLCLDSERVLLEIVLEGVHAGALALNHARVERLIAGADGVTGVQVADVLGGVRAELRARHVVNAAGPWIDELLATLGGPPAPPLFHVSRAFNLLTRRLPFEQAIGIPVPRRGRDDDALVQKGTDTCFVMPWGDYSMIGTRHLPGHGPASGRVVSDDEVRQFLELINPRLGRHALRDEDILGVFAGRLPHKPGTTGPNVVLEKHGRVVDHGREQGIRGLWSILAVKWTTAPTVARELVARIAAAPGAHPQGPAVATGVQSPVEPQGAGQGVDAVARESVRQRYGNAATAVLAMAERESLGRRIVAESPVIEAQVVHAARVEMAATLADAVLRRTTVGYCRGFDAAALGRCAELMARELGWNPAQQAQAVATARDVINTFRYGTHAAI